MSSPDPASAGHREEGTASVEAIAAVPFLLAAVLVAAQLGLAGQALWSAALAARAGARAALVGDDGTTVAKRALPPSLRPGSRVEEREGVSVEVAIPRLLPGLPRLTIGTKAELPGG